MDFIDEMFSNLSNYTKAVLPEGVFTNLLAEGIITGIGGVIIFVPQIGFGGEAQRPRSSHYATNLKAWRPSNRGQEGARPAHEADARSNPGDPGPGGGAMAQDDGPGGEHQPAKVLNTQELIFAIPSNDW